MNIIWILISTSSKLACIKKKVKGSSFFISYTFVSSNPSNKSNQTIRTHTHVQKMMKQKMCICAKTNLASFNANANTNIILMGTCISNFGMLKYFRIISLRCIQRENWHWIWNSNHNNYVEIESIVNLIYDQPMRPMIFEM